MLSGERLFAERVVEFVLAYLFGIAFRFFPVRAMRRISKASKDAVKADILSLIAFEIGMFAWMAVVAHLLLPSPPQANSIMFWFTMQIGMVFGFLTTYPANSLLIRSGIKQGI